MKFCMMTTFYPPYHFGGDAVQVYRLCQALAHRGHEVHVIQCLDAYRLGKAASKPGYDHHPNVKIHTLSGRAGFLSPLITQQTGHPGIRSGAIRSILQENRFDVIHYHNMSLIGPVAMTWGQAIKLYTLHEHWLVCPMHILWRYDREVCTKRTCLSCQVKGRIPPQLWRYTSLLRKCCQNVDCFIAPSQFTLEEHRRQGLPLPAKVIPHFLSATPDPEPIQFPSKLKPVKPYFLYAGRLEEFKGIRALIKVFSHYHDAELWIAGDGRQAYELKEMAREIKNIRFLGTIQPNELTSLYRDAIATVVPSLCYETFGLAAVESLSQGTPAIVHKLGGLEEIIRESQAGLTYSSEEELLAALKKLQYDDNLRRDFSTRARQAYAELWTEEKYLNAYFHLIQSCWTQKNTLSPGQVE